MGDDVPTDPVCIARPTPQARRAPQVQIPNTQHPILAIGRASYSEVGPSLPIPSGSPSHRFHSTVRATFRFGEVGYSSRGRRGKPNYLNLDRDFAVDELAVVYPILNAIFDPDPIVAEEADSFVCGRIG